MKAVFGLDCAEATAVPGGYLNEKWRVETNAGPVLIKRFHPDRYGSESRLNEIEAALQRHAFVREQGVPCPALWQYEGKFLRRSDRDTAYVVMEFCPGERMTPETVTAAQMGSLGEACGRMHRALALLPVTPDTKGWPCSVELTLAELGKSLNRWKDEPAYGALPDFRRAIERAGDIYRSLPPDLLNDLTPGVAHEDFAGDNLLFVGDKVSAIVDFDRCRYGYPLHDVGRALLSFCLKDGAFDREKAAAFLAGYSRYRPIGKGDLRRALQLTWCIETVWWVQPEFFTEPDEKPRRFLEEVLWLTENWNELGDNSVTF